MKYSEKYLDFELRDSGNSDGIVLLAGGESGRNLCEIDLGNYGVHMGNYGSSDDPDNIRKAKRYALVYFMIARPKVFGNVISAMITHGTGTMHCYNTLKNQLEVEGIAIPEDITSTGDVNMGILHDGLPVVQRVW